MGIPPVGMSFEQPKPVETKPVENTWCPNYDKSGDLEDFVMIRKVYYTIWNSFVRGFYQTARKNPVDEKCMGSWMDSLKDDIVALLNLIDEGKFGDIHSGHLKRISSGVIDVFYKNYEYCNVYAPVQDTFEWCASDVGTCNY